MDGLTTEHVATADGVLLKHTTGRPGQVAVTFIFDGDERVDMLPVVLHDHEMLRVRVERYVVPQRDVDPTDMWDRFE